MVIGLVASVCLSVCNALTVEIRDIDSSFFGVQVHLQNRPVMFVYKAHLVKITGTRKL